MTRITQSQLGRMSIGSINNAREQYNKYSNEVTSGLKVAAPGDSRFSGTINQYKDLLTRIEGHETRIQSAKAMLSFQDNVVNQLNDLIIRTQEIATQNANETVGASTRAQAAKEIFEIRDHIVQLANSRYQGKYIYGGADDDDAPFDAGSYAVPSGTGPETVRYGYDSTSTEPGNDLSRTINLTDDFTMTITSPGKTLFGGALGAIEKLGRALMGYSTETLAGPVYSGNAYNFPADTALQTRHIKDALDEVTSNRQVNVMPERIGLGAKLKRIETAEAILELSKSDAKMVLSSLQDADVDESATNLSLAQNGLNASYTVSAKVLQLSILNFL